MSLILTPSETPIMKCLWAANEPLTVRELQERLETIHGRSYAINTVGTFMTILMRKGVVARSKTKGAHRYRALIGREEYLQGYFQNFVDEWYNGSWYEMIATMIKSAHFTKEECEKLKKLLDEHVKQ